MAATDEPVIEARALRKTYGSTVAVDDVSLSVRADEIFALVGPNGAGKTTMVEILECLRTPTAGTATVLGHDVVRETAAIKERIGVLPQSFHAFARLTVRENVRLARDMYDAGLTVEAVLDRLGLDGYADNRFETLSGGYQQRTGLAMAIVSDPDVLFLDEPTTGLDPAARRDTWTQIERLADLGTTVVLTTHYMDEVEALADRAALLVEGSVMAVDRVETLVETYGGHVKLVLGGAGEVEDAAPNTLREVAADVYRTDAGDLVGVFEDRRRAQAAFGDLAEVAPDRSIDLVSAGMEDVFLELAGGVPDARGELR
jgi:ABC-2 type transport system ATP-binding protein